MSESSVKKRRRNFALLNREVIKPGYCVSCGGCEAVCPVYVISMEQLVPKLVGGCISCGACVDICLRYKQREEQPKHDEDDIGTIVDVYVGKTKLEDIHSRSQNGGIVTTLLVTAMKKGEIDGAIVTAHVSDLIGPVPQLALSEFEIRKASKSKYTLNPVLVKLPSIKLSQKEAVAFVGLPCHNETLNNIIDKKNLGADFRIKYRIGLFCMSSYDPKAFRSIITDNLGLEATTLTKTDCARGKFFFETPSGVTDIKIKECGGAKAEGCKYCLDFAAEFADISVGNIGVDDDSNIIIVRNDKGRELLDIALKDGLLDIQKIEAEKWLEKLAAAKKLSSSKKRGAKSLPPLTTD
jgi:coenzyme F420-reducing hydrogenase beta subunit